MRVAAIVVNWNTAPHLPACLDALDAQDHPDLEVVVIDNASTDGSDEVLRVAQARPRRHPLRVVHNRTNRGFAGAVNDGLAVVDADAVLVSNVDVVAAPDLVRRAVAVLEGEPRCGTVQPKLLRLVPAAGKEDRREPVLDTTGHVLTTARLVRNRGEGEVDRGQYDVAGELFGASGALVLHRRAMLDDVAWRHADGRLEHLTEDLFAFFDDVELDLRARMRGWTARYEPSAVARHERGGSGPRRTPFVEALNASNRLLVLLTCDDARSFLRVAPLVVATTGLKFVELVVTVPAAVVPTLRRVRLVAGCRRRRRQLLARATVPPGTVIDAWAVPFSWRAWITTWWRRVRGG